MSATRSDMPKILVVSHNVMGGSTGMGKTLANMLAFVPRECMAQLYFHSEVPTKDVCTSYYRVTDPEMLASLGRRSAAGTVFNHDDVRDARSSRVDAGATAKAYQLGRKRTSLVYVLRNTLWRLGRWDTPELDAWLRSFAPDVIFFAAGDYSFAYRIVHTIALRLGIPVVMWCADDYYLGHSLKGLVHRSLMRRLKRMDGEIASIIAISDKMARDYTTLFHQPICVVRMPVEDNPYRIPFAERRGIVYIGSLGVGRLKPLLELAREVRHAGACGFGAIDVYTSDKNEKTLAELSAAPGIRCHGQIDEDQVLRVLGTARYVLHVESFEAHFKERTRYSLSTKIGESLASGACLIAYGPSNIASIEYLSEHHAGIVLNEPRELCEVLVDEGNSAGVLSRIENSLSLARDLHDATWNRELLRKALIDACA